MEDTPILEVKPVVVPAQFLVGAPLVAAFGALFPGVFALVISNILGALMGGDRFDGPVVVYGAVAYALGFLAMLYLAYLKVFKEPERTTYAVYKDRLEYDEGLLVRQRRTLIFDQVIDVQLTEGLLQQTRDAGTIKLVTQQLVASGEAQLSNRQISLNNVPEPRKVYDLIRSLALEKNRAG
ncbi:MAG: PH domain-containing protein [Sedimentisphaerales bacterium]|nr:PH domain-containing protein [Sedimentisphaerales bacterium]